MYIKYLICITFLTQMSTLVSNITSLMIQAILKSLHDRYDVVTYILEECISSWCNVDTLLLWRFAVFLGDVTADDV